MQNGELELDEFELKFDESVWLLQYSSIWLNSGERQVKAKSDSFVPQSGLKMQAINADLHTSEFKLLDIVETRVAVVKIINLLSILTGCSKFLHNYVCRFNLPLFSNEFCVNLGLVNLAVLFLKLSLFDSD